MLAKKLELDYSNPWLAEIWLLGEIHKFAPSDRRSPDFTFGVPCWGKSPTPHMQSSWLDSDQSSKESLELYCN
jgi:hypothetical protein